MTIGRTDDPESPSRVSAFFRAARLFGTGSRNPSGPAVMVPPQQGRTHERNRPARQNLASALEPKGPSTHDDRSNRRSREPVKSLGLLQGRAPVWDWIAEPIWASGHGAASARSDTTARHTRAHGC